MLHNDIKPIDLDKFKPTALIGLVENTFCVAIAGANAPIFCLRFFDLTDLEKSIIFNTRDKDVVEDFFMSVIAFVCSSKEEELNYWLNFLVDNNGLPCSTHDKSNGDISTALKYIEAIAQLLSNIWLYPLKDYPTVNDEVMAMYARQELTLGNYIFLKRRKLVEDILAQHRV